MKIHCSLCTTNTHADTSCPYQLKKNKDKDLLKAINFKLVDQYKVKLIALSLKQSLLRAKLAYLESQTKKL